MDYNAGEVESTAVTTSDRRTRQRERRRVQLYDAAISLFVEKSFDSTTMEDIADRADVARATVFNHFPRKVTFLQEWGARARVRALAAAYPGETVDASLRAVLVRYLTEIGASCEDSRAESVAVIQGSMHSTAIWRQSPLAADLGGMIAKAEEAGELDAGIDADRIGLFLSSTCYVILTSWASEEQEPFSLSEEMVDTVDLVLNGLLPRSNPRPARTAQSHATRSST